MTKTVAPLIEFSDLRRIAIQYAQDASREQWSDYNVHDPGVTLLEQTCFALSQLAYQSALPIRDLLTTPRHSFLFREIGMFHPRKVLEGQPVTHSDIESWISDCDDIESVKLTPRGAPFPGQYDITVFPTHYTSMQHEELTNIVRIAFARRRPLCTALNAVHIAQRVNVTLAGQIEITPGTLPETVAAHIYHVVFDMLAGLDSEAQTQTGATRRQVYDAPERLSNLNHNAKLQTLSLANELSAIRQLSGVLEIYHLELRLPDGSKPLPANAYFFHCALPDELEIGDVNLNRLETAARQLLQLELTLNGVNLPLDSTIIHEEYVRIHAERLAHTHHPILASDWDVMKPGRPRVSSQSHVDSLLPNIYRSTGYEPDELDSTISQYRQAINCVLESINAALTDLPDTFQANRVADFSDPVVHRERIALLNYLIALQGVEMPNNFHTGIHCYRCTSSIHRFEIQWRLNALDILPRAQSARGIGPSPNLKEHGGFLSMLSLMCDLDLATVPHTTPTLKSYGLKVAPNAPLKTMPTGIKIVPIRTYNLLDLVPIEIPSAKPFDAAQLENYSPFVSNNTITSKLLRRLSDPDCFFILPAKEGKWQVVADLGNNAPLWYITAFSRDPNTLNDPHEDARRCAARLRTTWRMLNRGSESLHLIEPVLSAGNDPYPAYSADLVLPNWTARCALENYRNYVQSQMEDHAPAHLMFKLHWLSVDQTAAFQALIDNRATSLDLHIFLNHTAVSTL